ncbi:EpsG family protein [Halpernia sp.]|uniref:EpsG family protein n=1 Tax=Halpernia sp. TaxID=2782209 RepID=UPI003A8CB89F
MLFYFLGIILGAICVYYMVQITYTADYPMYESYFKKEYENTDFIFYKSAYYFRHHNLTFQDLFGAHILVISALYLLFISKFNSNFFYIFGVYLLLSFIPYVNQIRFYLAFPCFLLAAYYLLLNRKVMWFCLFGVLGGLSHSAILPLYSFFLFYLFVPEKFYKNILIFGSIILFITSYIVSNTTLYAAFEHFGEYIKNENQSSFLGGVFSMLPTLVILIPLYLLDKKYLGNRNLPTYKFLKKLSFYTVLLIPASTFIQIIGYRYVFPFLVVWIMFFLYLIKDKPLKVKIRHFFISYLLIIVVLYLQYILPLEVLGESSYLEEINETIKSINIYR